MTPVTIPNASSRANVRHRAAYDTPQPNGAEAVAMRRIVAEMGYWLSPLLKDHPVPVLTEWERTVDLTRLAARATVVPASQTASAEQPDAPQVNRAGRERSYSTPTLKEVEAKRSKRPSTKETEPVAPPKSGHGPRFEPLSPEAKAAALVAITARAAEQEAAKDAKVRLTHAWKILNDPVYREECRAKRRAKERRMKARAKEAKAAKAAAEEAVKKAEAEEARKAEVEARKAKAAPGPIPTAKELVAEAKRAAAIEEEARLLSLLAKETRKAKKATTKRGEP